MENLACLGLFLPLIGFLLLTIFSCCIGRLMTGLIACLAVFIPFLCFSWMLLTYEIVGASPFTLLLFSWIPVEGINADFALRIDPLSLWMTLIITGVGSLIHLYANGYMDHDEEYAKFFAFLNFFIFCMLLLVLASNLVLLFVGWEGVGLASYLLIGFWYQKTSASNAATKAFVVNRVGDLGFLLGLLLIFHVFGTSDIAQVSTLASQNYSVGTPVITMITLLLFFGATGKSAQLPLHTWLADAMEGPTPVSALIHAATMVTAGVYLVVRMHTVFMLSPITMNTIGIVGGATSLFAAFSAVGQTDLKRVLAYSTVSQLGLMFLACGVGAFYAAMFHLTTHAFVKALLFLSAGNVVHMMHGNTQMANMGGLSSFFPKTRWLFFIGVMALSGIPPLAAFFSKDLILEQEYLAGYEVLFFIALGTSLLTAFYLTRAYCLAFTGAQRFDKHTAETIHEARTIMIFPVTILALLSTFGGLLGFATGKTPWFENFFAEIGITLAERELDGNIFLHPSTWMTFAGTLMGIGLSAVLYTRYQDKLGSTLRVLTKSFYVDEIYNGLIVIPLKTLSRLIAGLSEPFIFDGSIFALALSTQGTAKKIQQLQSGQIRSYVAWMVIGAIGVIVFFAL